MSNILEGKKVIIMGLRNKWSIAWGAAQSAYENGAQVIGTCAEGDFEKVSELIKEIPGAKLYPNGDFGYDENIEKLLKQIKEENGKVDGILHAIAHAFTDDLRNDFVKTSREGYAHACDISSYSFVATARIAKELDMLNEGASLVTYTYMGSEKAIEGYNVMGVAKAALESSVRYLAANLGRDGFRVNAISAGPIKTLSAKGIKDFGTILNVVEERAALHKNVTPMQVGDATSFLFSNLSSAITGEVIHVDNGYSIMGV